MAYPQELICIVCDRELDSIMEPSQTDDSHTPYNGTVFTSYGHYGSTIFDEMGDRHLSLTICDLCIIDRINHISVGTTSSIVIDGEIFKKRIYQPFTTTENEIEWVKEASQSYLLSLNSPKRILQDETIIEYKSFTEQGILIELNGDEKTIEKDSTFISNNGNEFVVDWCVENEQEINPTTKTILSFSLKSQQ